ncbi:MAG: hypothetical protein ACM3SW_05425 [Actinomycetota bacterium]
MNMNVNVSDREAEVAREILERAYRELLLEIARAEHHEFKVALQEREKLLKGLLDKLNSLETVHS